MSQRPRLSLIPLILGLAAIAVGYTAFTTARYVVHNHQVREEERGIRAELEALGRDHEQLSAVRDYLKSDEYIEDIARRVLGLVRPGETLVVVSGTDEPASAAAAPASTPGAPWWKALFAQSLAVDPSATAEP